MNSTKRLAATYIPLGVADSEGAIGVVQNSTGGLERVDLKTGSTTWHSAVGVTPLLIAGELVFARADSKLADTLEVIRISLKSGEQSGNPLQFRLPDWSHFASADRQEFDCRLALEGPQLLVLDWSVNCSYEGGAAAPASIRNEKQKRIHGISKLDMSTTHCETVPLPPVNEQLGTEKSRVSYKVRGKWSDQPFESDAKMVHLTGNENSLRVTDSGEQESKLLLDGPWFAPTVTPDGQFIVVQRRMAASEESSDWDVISLLTGHTVCKFETELQPELPCVIGSQLFYIVTDPSGAAHYCKRSLDMGKLLWQKVLDRPSRKSQPPPLRR